MIEVDYLFQAALKSDSSGTALEQQHQPIEPEIVEKGVKGNNDFSNLLNGNDPDGVASGALTTKLCKNAESGSQENGPQPIDTSEPGFFFLKKMFKSTGN